jgi:hypothetical protein
LLAAVGGAYGFTKDAAANLREKDDSYNTAIGGMVAGAVMGLRCDEPVRFRVSLLMCN